MAVEVYVRNPDACIRECVEVGLTNLVFDRGYIVKRGIDVDRFAHLYIPPSMKYRILVIGDSDQGALEITQDSTMDRPSKVHALWEYGEDIAELEDKLEDIGPGGMVVVTRIPLLSTGIGKRFLALLNDFQLDYDDRIIHLHGTYSWRAMFGLDFKSIDFEPRVTAKKGKVVLPNGKSLQFEHAQVLPQWMAAVGVNPASLSIPRERCMFNIKSALWAAEYYKKDYKFITAHTEPDEDGNIRRENKSIQMKRMPVKLGDKFLCDVCSLQSTCKYFRVGSVCSVPDAEGTELARYFKTRDADKIIDGLGSLLALQLQRLEEGRENELDDGKIDAEVTKLVNGIFDRGVRLAKLINPELAAAGAARVKVSLTQNNATINAANPTALMAGIVNELEARGIPRSEITPEMVKQLLSKPENERREIVETVAIERATA